MQELTTLRTENGKTYHLGADKFAKDIFLGPVHYKNNYDDSAEDWKDIDLTVVDGKITKAPYELTIEGNKVTVRCKRTGKISTVELSHVGSKKLAKTALKIKDGKHGKAAISTDVDYEMIAGPEAIKFQRTIKSADAAHEARFNITGDIPIRYQAFDADDNPIELTTDLTDGLLTEKIKDKTGLKYPLRVDPTLDLQVDASAKDCRVSYSGSDWSFYSNASGVTVGYGSSISYKFGGLMVFAADLPENATISTAYLTLRCSTACSNTTVNSRITGEKTTNAADTSDLANYQGRRGTVVGGANNNNITSAQVAWDDIGAWTLNADYNSPEIKTVVQEIANLGAITNMGLFWDDHDDRSTASSGRSRSAYSYDGSSTYAPKLHIEYVVPTVKSLTDTGAGADSVSGVRVSISLAETGAGADGLGNGVNASVPLTDTGAGSDIIAFLANIISLLESGAGVEGSPAITVDVPLTDTGAGADVISLISALIQLADTGVGADGSPSITVNVGITDTGAGADDIAALIKSLLIQLADTGTGTDGTPAIAVNVNVADTGAGTDATPSISVTVPLTDTGAGADGTPAITVNVPLTDTGAGVDDIAYLLKSLFVQLADTGAGADAIPLITVNVPVSESGSGVDAIALITALIQLADTGSGADESPAIIVTVTLTDSGAGTDESPAINVALLLTDTGAGTEGTPAINVRVPVTDSGAGTDILSLISALLQLAESGAGTDAAPSITVSVSVAETGAGADGNPGITVNIPVSDTGTGADVIALLSAIISVTEYCSGYDDLRITLSKLLTDTGTGVDTIAFISSFIRLLESSAGIDVIVRYMQAKKLKVTFAAKKAKINVTAIKARR